MTGGRAKRAIVRLTSSGVAAALIVFAVPAVAAAGPTGSVSINNVSLVEGTGGTVTATFTVSLAPPKGSVTVTWATANQTAVQPADYASASGTITLTKTNKNVPVVVTVNPDSIDEPNETFLVNLSNPVGGPIADGQGVGTITDDDLPSVSIDDVVVIESDVVATAQFTASLSNPSPLPVSVNFATANGTAIQPLDYTAASGQLNFAPGDTQETVDVAVAGDVSLEVPPDETFTVSLSNPSNATIGDGQGLGSITDDDGNVTISIADATVTEGTGGTTAISFDLSLSGPRGLPVAVGWATSAGSAADPADFTGDTGTTTFAPGDLSGTVDIVVKNDALDEPDETFTVDLSGPLEATIADAQATGTIVDDDKIVSILTAAVTKTRRQIVVTGTLVPAASVGDKVTVTLSKKTKRGYRKAGSKVAALGVPTDLNTDGVLERPYTAKLKRPKQRGSYRVTSTFAGDVDRTADTVAKNFKL